jgi:hypothetical protein
VQQKIRQRFNPRTLIKKKPFLHQCNGGIGANWTTIGPTLNQRVRVRVLVRPPSQNVLVGFFDFLALRPAPEPKVPDAIAGFYDQKTKVHSQFIAMATAFATGPKPGVDYSALAADAPKLTATLEYLDRSLFQATPLIFGMLIADKPDSQGHMSRLRITRAERDGLVRSLQIDFDGKMDQTDQNCIVSSASVLRDYLIKKGYKCSDDPP